MSATMQSHTERAAAYLTDVAAALSRPPARFHLRASPAWVVVGRTFDALATAVQAAVRLPEGEEKKQARRRCAALRAALVEAWNVAVAEPAPISPEAHPALTRLASLRYTGPDEWWVQGREPETEEEERDARTRALWNDLTKETTRIFGGRTLTEEAFARVQEPSRAVLDAARRWVSTGSAEDRAALVTAREAVLRAFFLAWLSDQSQRNHGATR